MILSNRFRSSFTTVIFFSICLLILSGCASKGQDIDPTANWSVEKLYQDGSAEMNDGNYKDAADRFIAVEARFPFGPYAQQSLINLAYVQWKQNEPEQALATITRFEQQYPNHPGTDYMLYLKGLILFTPPSAVFSRFTQQDPSERDPQALRNSYEAFNSLITRFPDSRYAPDARKRMSWLVNIMADHQVHLARFYYDRQGYVAAINRAQNVITEFEGVPAAESALYIMMMSYKKLGLTELSQDSERVLLANFPNTKLIADGFPDKYSKWNPMRLL
ncbi:MAG: outer membrane protein assembly factor BamD [Burkholderiaceae bacterium]|nr:outer membrane protein assembly factor BamD [Burkholderiaceae bacterium]